MQVNIRKGVALGLFGVFEADVVKIDRAVLHFGHGVLGALQRALFAEDFDNTLGRFLRHRDHRKDHREHHQAHEDLEAVGQHRGHLADVEVQPAGGDDGVGAVRHDKDHAGVDAELHHRAVEGHDALGSGEVLLDVFGRGAELFLLIFLPHIAFDNPHGLHVFLHGIVEGVILAEDAAEQRGGGPDDQKQPDEQKRDGEQEDHGQPAAHDKAHDEGENQHQRAADGHPDDHHVGHLDVGDVGGQAGDKA